MPKRKDWNRIAANGVGIFLLFILFFVLWHETFGEVLFKPGTAVSLRGRRIPIGAPSDGYTIKYEAASDTFYWAPDLTGEGGTGIFSQDSLTAYGYYYNPTAGDFQFNIAGSAFRVKFIDSCIYLDTHIVACVNNLGQLEFGAPGLAEFDSLLALGKMKFVSPDSAETVFVNWVRMDSMIDLTGRYAAGAGSFSLSTFMAYAAAGYFDTTTLAVDPDDKLYVKLADAATADGAGHTIATYFSATTHNHDLVYATISHAHAGADISSGTISTDRYSSFADLTAESKIGTGADQVAAGNHNHDGTYSLLGHTHTGYILDAYDDLSSDGDIGTGAAQVAAGNHNHSSAYQPLEATLTDIADGTIAENLVNTANPWAANEITETDPVAMAVGANLDTTGTKILAALNNRLDLEDTATTLKVKQGINLNVDNVDDDGYLYFFKSIANGAYLRYRQSESRFYLTDSLYLYNQNITTTGGGNLGFVKINTDSIADFTGTGLSVTSGVLNVTETDAAHDNFSELGGTVADAQIAAGAVDGGAAGEIQDQTIDKNDIDSTASNVVFDDAYRGTSASADSAYATEYFAKIRIHDSLMADTAAFLASLTRLGKVTDDTTHFKLAYDTLMIDTAKASEGELEDSLDAYLLKSDTANQLRSTRPDTGSYIRLTDSLRAVKSARAATLLADKAVITSPYKSDSTKSDSALATTAYVDSNDVALTRNVLLQGDFRITGRMAQVDLLTDFQSNAATAITPGANDMLQLGNIEPLRFLSMDGSDSALADSMERGGIHPDWHFVPWGIDYPVGDSAMADFIGNPIYREAYTQGTDQNDLHTKGTYSESFNHADTYYVEIVDEAANPETFRWRANDTSWESGSWADTLNCVLEASALTINKGVQVYFGAVTGHSGAEKWQFTANKRKHIITSSPSWNYLMAYSYTDSVQGFSQEWTTLLVSHDTANWELPWFIDQNGDTIFWNFPLFTSDSVGFKDSLWDTTSNCEGDADPDLFFDTDGRLVVITIESQNDLKRPLAVNDTDAATFVAVRANKGLLFYDDGVADKNEDFYRLFTYFRVGSAASPISPSIISAPNNKYWIYTVLDTGSSYCIQRLVNDSLFGSWSDTTDGIFYVPRGTPAYFGTWDTCVLNGFPSTMAPWHINAQRVFDEIHLFITAGKPGGALSDSIVGSDTVGHQGNYFCKSYDGVHFECDSLPYLYPGTGHLTTIYRTSGIPAFDANGFHYKMMTSGLSSNGVYHIYNHNLYFEEKEYADTVSEYEYLRLDRVHGYVDGKDSIDATLPGQKRGGITWLGKGGYFAVNDSSTGTGLRYDTLSFSTLAPYNCIVESLIVIFKTGGGGNATSTTYCGITRRQLMVEKFAGNAGIADTPSVAFDDTIYVSSDTSVWTRKARYSDTSETEIAPSAGTNVPEPKYDASHQIVATLMTKVCQTLYVKIAEVMVFVRKLE
ncbi:MAG: hypothetical protein PHW53_04650 [Patescibacteria group bacterium]|nr:hypothetical protein [Patescibacteria group bacterium]